LTAEQDCELLRRIVMVTDKFESEAVTGQQSGTG